MATQKRKADSSPKQAKRAATAGSFKPGVSGNPGGRARTGESFASVLRDFLAMDGPQAAKACATYAKDMNKLPAGVNLRAMIALRWITSVLNDPTPGLVQQLIDRVDGPVPSKISGDKDDPFLIRVEYVKRSNSVDGVASSTAED